MSMDNDMNGGGGAELSEALSSSAEFEPVMEETKSSGRGAPLLFMLALVGAGVFYFMFLKGGPDASSAAAQGEDAQKTVAEFLEGGDQNIAQMEAMLADTEKVVEQFHANARRQQVPLEQLQTNPFRYSDAKEATADPAEAKAEAERLQREQERQQAMAAFAQLQLQSIISGSRKACMINNTLVQEGQQVEQFIVERINPGSVTVRTGVYRFELTMQK